MPNYSLDFLRSDNHGFGCYWCQSHWRVSPPLPKSRHFVQLCWVIFSVPLIDLFLATFVICTNPYHVQVRCQWVYFKHGWEGLEFQLQDQCRQYVPDEQSFPTKCMLRVRHNQIRSLFRTNGIWPYNWLHFRWWSRNLVRSSTCLLWLLQSRVCPTGSCMVQRKLRSLGWPSLWRLTSSRMESESTQFAQEQLTLVSRLIYDSIVHSQ